MWIVIVTSQFSDTYVPRAGPRICTDYNAPLIFHGHNGRLIECVMLQRVLQIITQNIVTPVICSAVIQSGVTPGITPDKAIPGYRWLIEKGKM